MPQKAGRNSLPVLGTHKAARFGDPQTEAHIRNKHKAQFQDERLLPDRPDRDFRWSDMPWSVLVDRNLVPVDWGVYGCMASRTFKVDTFQMGTRWIAESLGIKKKRAQASVVRLVKNGHVEVIRAAKGSAAPVYRLTSSIFAKRQKVIVSDKQGNRETTRHDLERKRELARKLRIA